MQRCTNLKTGLLMGSHGCLLSIQLAFLYRFICTISFRNGTYFRPEPIQAYVS